MALAQPKACKPIAFESLARQVAAIETTNGLLRAAIAISMHELAVVNTAEVERAVLAITGRVRSRVRGTHRRALLAHLHDELFERLRWRGNSSDYYNPANSYLPTVLQTGQGIPISLSLLYCVIARRLGLRADGINAPGHFLVQVFDDTTPVLIDPFHAGRALSREDAMQLIRDTTGEDLLSCEMALRPATHRQWIRRMLHNLMLVFEMQERTMDADAMREMLTLVNAA